MRHSHIALAAVVFLAGCGTYHQGTYQRLSVRTPGADNATCKLTTKTNSYRSLTPRSIPVERSDQPLTIVCDKAGFKTASVVVNPRVEMKASTAMNVSNGVVPGTVWDYASNAVFEYPDPIYIAMIPLPRDTSGLRDPYVLQKKPEPVKAEPPATAPEDKAAADKAAAKSSRK